MSLLKEIIMNKKVEVQQQKNIMPEARLMAKKFPKTRDFISAINKRNNISIIAELKKMSPSAGIIRENFNLIEIAKIYQDNGASALSLLTDRQFFGGDMSQIEEVKKKVMLPILRKDFIIDEYQIYQSRWLGADAILLIARILSVNELNRFILLAKKLELACVIEIHTLRELKKVLLTNAEIIGINNRDLETLKVDINNSLQLIKKIPNCYVTISESGIKNRHDVERLSNAGFDGLLIGETLLKANDIGAKLNKLLAV